MPSFDAILNTTPRVEYFPTYDPYGEMDGISFRGIRALAYDGVDLEGMHTKVFAHIGYPENANDLGLKGASHVGYPENANGAGLRDTHPNTNGADLRDTHPNTNGAGLNGTHANASCVDTEGTHTNPGGLIPAVVLVHAGGGHPNDKWIRLWNQRGYAAIAMDTTGFFPQSPAPFYSEMNIEGLERKLVPPFAEDGYTVSPAKSNMHDGALPIGDQWMYHAVAQVILAHNILRADPLIDNDRIGLVGISWGGVVSSIVIGYDSRFAFTVPIYGSAYLGSGYPEICRSFRNPAVFPWLAEHRLDNARMPILWLCWNDDCCFSLNSNSLSYLHSLKNNPLSRLSMLDNMMHSHYYGAKPEESYWFADMVLSGGEIPQVWAEYDNGIVRYGCSAPVRSVRLFWLDGAINYVRRKKYGTEAEFMEREWQKMVLDPDKTEMPIPEGAAGRYVEFTLENVIVLTTEYVEP